MEKLLKYFGMGPYRTGYGIPYRLAFWVIYVPTGIFLLAVIVYCLIQS